MNQTSTPTQAVITEDRMKRFLSESVNITLSSPPLRFMQISRMTLKIELHPAVVSVFVLLLRNEAVFIWYSLQYTEDTGKIFPKGACKIYIPVDTQMPQSYSMCRFNLKNECNLLNVVT